MAAGELIVKFKKLKDITFFTKCPSCGRDLTEDIKNALGIYEQHKFLPTNTAQITNCLHDKKDSIYSFHIECCWFGVTYYIYLDKLRKVQQINIPIIESNTFKKEIDNIHKDITKKFGIPKHIFGIEDKRNED